MSADILYTRSDEIHTGKDWKDTQLHFKPEDLATRYLFVRLMRRQDAELLQKNINKFVCENRLNEDFSSFGKLEFERILTFRKISISQKEVFYVG